MANPHEHTIEARRGEGFVIVDEFGELVEPTRCYSSHAAAKAAIKRMIENYEPPETGDAWTGGFAENH